MKPALSLLLLVACAGSPTSATPVPPTPAVAIPDCPTCPACEQQECPTCPECPKAPEPVAADWHCMELTPPLNKVKSYCWPSSAVCERYREKALKDPKHYGKPSACRAQRTAFCHYLGDPNPMSRQTLCSGTLEECEIRRQTNIVAPPSNTTIISKCRPMLNTDTFSYDVDLNDSP